MTAISDRIASALKTAFGDRFGIPKVFGDEVTVTVKAADAIEVLKSMRDESSLRFDTLIDVCGIDYLGFGVGYEGLRYAVVYHLLSVEHNHRLRVRVYCEDDDFPRVDSVLDLWPSANWFEREAFDLFGIVFEGHPDLRRILTDYGFIRPSVPQGFSGIWQCRDALRPGAASRSLPAGVDRTAQQRAPHRARGNLRRYGRVILPSLPRRPSETLVAEIRNYTMNFGYDVTCRSGKLVCTEVHRFIAPAPGLRHG